MWEYKTETFKIMINDNITLSKKLNEFGKDGWEVFSIDKKVLQSIDRMRPMLTTKIGYEYEAQLKKRVE
jgi:hypothetical protein